MDKQEFEKAFDRFIFERGAPIHVINSMREYVQKMHNANERLELIEARLLGQFSYEQDEAARQIIAAYLGYDPREKAPPPDPLPAGGEGELSGPKFKVGQIIEIEFEGGHHTVMSYHAEKDGYRNIYLIGAGTETRSIKKTMWVHESDLKGVGNE